jgi:lysozyme
MALSEVTKIIEKKNIDRKKYPCVIVGIRGYFKDTMGKAGVNDRGMYDDAIFLVTPDVFMSRNANTDPTAHYKKGVACLKPGVYEYKMGPHGLSRGPYPAFRQFGNVTVIRDGVGERTDSPNARFWINIHKGGFNTTSSAGCQTIYPDQWLAFQTTGYAEMKRHKQTVIPYILVEA